MLHYVRTIRQLGSADGYNTEGSERLHIDYAKEAYRASNRRDYVEQMTKWLRRQEAVHQYAAYLSWRRCSSPQPAEPSPKLDDDRPEPTRTGVASRIELLRPVSPPAVTATISGLGLPPTHRVARKARFPHITAAHIMSEHGTASFLPALAMYLGLASRSHTTRHQRPPGLHDRFDVYSQIRISIPAHPAIGTAGNADHIIRAIPSLPTRLRGKMKAATFSTVLARYPGENESTVGTALAGLRAARVRAIFSLPDRFRTPGRPTVVAYVQWYTPFRAPDPIHGLRTITRATRNRRPFAEVISIDRIARSCHLLPSFGRHADRSWHSDNVHDNCNTFHLNTWIDIQTFAEFGTT
jgi:hypothetical protein